MYGYCYSAYNRLSFLGGFDSNASAFFVATGITDPAIQGAINTLCVDLKKYGVFDKMKAIYPFVGGTATTHKFNLVNPADTDAAFRLSFLGGVTHSSNGVLGNGTNGYANTFLTPSTSLSQNNTHISIYSRTNLNTATFDIGSANSGFVNGLYFTPRSNDNNGYNRINGVTWSNPSTTSVGNFILNRTSVNTTKLHKNNNIDATNNGASTGLSNSSIYIFGINVGNLLNLPRQGFYSFATIGDGLSDEDSANLYYSVQKFQTTLGRQVGTPIYSSTATDVNARLFLGATNIQDATITSAVDTLVQGLKTDGIWTKLKAVYPFVGGTATTHKFNLANALDEDTSFRLAFSGGWTHSSNGATPNGTNGYADTFLTPSISLTQNSASLGYYGGNDIGTALNKAAMGSQEGPPYKVFAIIPAYTGFGLFGDINDGSNTYTANTNTSGFILASRTLSTQKTHFIRGTQTIKTEASTGLTSRAVVIGARRFNAIDFYSAIQHRFTFIGDGLTSTEITNLNTRVQAFQTTLNRQV